MTKFPKRSNKSTYLNTIKATQKSYGFRHKKSKGMPPLHMCHFTAMQKTINEPIVKGLKGIDVGSGCGFDTYIMAKNNPSVEIVSVDLSDGVYKTKELTSDLRNVQIIKCSVLNMPIKDNVFDFAYSYGVLHHTPDPPKGLLEIARVLKKNCPVFVYLYEDHSENFIKYIAGKIIHQLRKVTLKIPLGVLDILCRISSPFVFIIFTLPSKILRRFRITRHFANKIPFNYGTGPFSLNGDLFDTFATPIEHKFSKQGVYDLFVRCGFRKINITRIADRAGWVAWGYKE